MTDAEKIPEALGDSRHGDCGKTCCPAHRNSKTPALTLSNADDGKLFLCCHAGCRFEKVIVALSDRGISSDPFEHSEKLVNVSSLDQTENRARSIWLGTRGIEKRPAEGDLQSGAIIQIITNTCGSRACQTAHETPKACKQVVKPENSDLTKKNPGATAIATGADIKSEVTKLHQQDKLEKAFYATFYWDRGSRSVEPLHVSAGVV